MYKRTHTITGRGYYRYSTNILFQPPQLVTSKENLLNSMKVLRLIYTLIFTEYVYMVELITVQDKLQCL